MIVLDASTVVEITLGLSGHGSAVARLGSESAHAPHLLSLEVAQSIRRHERAGLVPPARAAAGVGDAAQLDIVLHEHELLLPRVWQLRHNLTAYDAAYVALAEVLDAPLVTFDAHLAAAPGHDATIELLTAV